MIFREKDYSNTMKIISLNAWCGRAGKPLYNFFEEYNDADIFCLQEVDLDGSKFGPDVVGNDNEGTPIGDPDLFYSIGKILSHHHGYFSPTLGRWWGNAIYIKKSLYRKTTASGELLVSDAQQ